MGNMFKHTPLAVEARITRLERELAALRAASAEMLDAYDLFRAEDESFSNFDEIEYSHTARARAEMRFINAKIALKALLAEGETDG